MKLKIIISRILLAISFFGFVICSNAQWHWQNPYPTGHDIRSIFFIEASFGWIVAERDVFLTNDGGANWSKKYTGSENLLNKIHFSDLMNGWAVGTSGLIIHSSDGGNTWISQNSSTETNLNSVFFIDQYKGWAAGGEYGSDGIILQTSNGGLDWETQVDSTRGIYDIYFVDWDNGWAVGGSWTGSGSVILHTIDGGITWEEQNCGSSIKRIFGVFFTDINNGWAVGGYQSGMSWSGRIIHTNDGGLTWQQQTCNASHYLADVSFIDSSRGWAIGRNGDILGTANGGNNWYTVNTYTDRDLSGICFVDLDNGWIAGKNGTVLHTTNGGNSWPEQSRCATIYNLYDVHFFDQNHGHASGTDGTILKTNNGGHLWEIQNTFVDYEITGLYTHDQFKSWAVGGSWSFFEGWMSEGAILYTDNGGNNWEVQYELQRDLHAVHFFDEMTGWAFGDKGAILHSTDGGTTWEDQSISLNNYIKSVAVIDSDNIWIACRNVGYECGGSIFKYNNAGNSWDIVHASTDGILTSISFADELNGWAAGETNEGKGFIITTMDGGIIWEEQIDTIPGPIRDIHFINAEEGWAIGDLGTTISTANGGETWELHERVTYFDFSAIHFTDESKGWICGENGAILYNEIGGITEVYDTGIQSANNKLYCYPNPVQKSANIIYTLEKSSHVNLDIVDLTGKRLINVIKKSQKKGEYFENIDVSAIPSGIYVVRLSLYGLVETCKLIVLN